MSTTEVAQRCPRCRQPNDAEALQCTTCGEILKFIHYGISNQAAAVRSIVVPSVDPAILAAELQVYDSRQLSWLINRICLAGFAALGLAGILFGASWVFLLYYVELEFAAGITTGVAGCLFAGAGLVWVYGQLRETATRRQSQVQLRRAELAHVKATAEQRVQAATLRAYHTTTTTAPLPAPQQEYVRTAPPQPQYRHYPSGPSTTASLVHNLATYRWLTGAALFVFLFLPQYQVFTNYSGLGSMQKLMTSVLRRDPNFLNPGAFAALLVPFALLAQVALAWNDRIRPLVATSFTTLALLLVVYLTELDLHENILPEYQKAHPASSAETEIITAMSTQFIGFQYGFLVLALLVAATAFLSSLRRG